MILRKLKIRLISAILLLNTGCGTSGLYLEQTRKGRLGYIEGEVKTELRISPKAIEKEKAGIKIRVEHYSHEELDEVFKDRRKFGKLAGGDPFPEETIVFLVRVANNSRSKIKVNPSEFVIVDDLGNQYLYLNPDSIIHIYESKSVVYSFAKSTQELAPGIYGAPADLASTIAGGRIRRKFYLLKQIELGGGYVYPTVVYDGYVAFLKPISSANKLKLIFANIKVKFDSDDRAQESLDFEFEFNIIK